jgi:hypothetical protein
MRRLILACLIGVLAVPSMAWAGGAGNPATTIGRENYGIAVEVEEQIKRIDDDTVRSRRYVGKFIWGATDKLDIYARLGASDLRVAAAELPRFEGPAGMTWGGGARYNVLAMERPALASYVDVQMLSFRSKKDTDVQVVVVNEYGVGTYMEHYYTHYKWNEVQISFVTSWQRDVFAPYLGFDITNVFGNVKREYSSEIIQGVDHESNDFREDAIAEFIMGLELDLGGTGLLSGEIRLSRDNDVSFFIGVSEIHR